MKASNSNSQTPKTVTAEIREALVCYLTSKMRFREDLAVRSNNPTGKNAVYAESLNTVISHVELLDDNDRMLLNLASACDTNWWSSFGHNEWEGEIHNIAIHCGSKEYPISNQEAVQWLERWVTSIIYWIQNAPQVDYDDI